MYIPVADNTILPLKGHKLSKLQNTFKSIKLLIIEEYPILSREMLSAIDVRLRQATNKDEIFGGISVILSGDRALNHLYPVCSKPLYDQEFENTSEMNGYLCYKKFETIVWLE